MDENEKKNSPSANYKHLSRSEAEKQCLEIFYAMLIRMSIKEELDVISIVQGITEVPYEETNLFVKEMVVAFLKHYKEIAETYDKHMKKWTFDRLDYAEQAILLLAYCHFYYAEEKVDKRIVINVAINFAKDYLGNPKDYKFVNAILDNVIIDENR
ncbi:MAG: hypothetical protein K5694_03295 [Bacilli bacterium]|nr:hypothetical protein [Bacilli bacterium]